MSSKMAPKNSVFYRNQNWHYPKVTHGKGIYLYTDDGKEYIDGCSGSAVANIGHGNEEIAEHAKDQMQRIAFTHLSRFTTDAIEKCAALISELTPKGLSHTYFVSGGSEAVETSIKLARQYFVERDKQSSKSKLISRWTSFHGNTLGALGATGISSRKTIYAPLLVESIKINQCYCYRCPYKSSYPECGGKCAYELERAIKVNGPDNVMAFIAESIVGSAAPGLNPPKEYFKIIRDICTRYDVLLIIDEVMAGLGRTGKNFGINHYDVIPDIMTIAKGMSCGYTPIGAAIANDKIFDTIMMDGSGTFFHGHTYGGNPLSASIAAKVLEITKRERYFQNAETQGHLLMNKLNSLYEIPIVGDIRGKGLMIGIEFVKNKESKEPFPIKDNVRGLIMKNCFKEQLVIYPDGGSVDGINGDHLLIAPPLNITTNEVEELFSRLKRGIEKTFMDLKQNGSL